MKICTWNLMRPNARTTERNTFFTDTLAKTNADIIVLTETNSVIQMPEEYFFVSTRPLPKKHDGYPFQEGENRATIYSKYPIIKNYPAADEYTSVCVAVETPFGPLIVYGTIIGFLGGKYEPFESDLRKQTLDLAHLVQQGNVCFTGDVNVSFSGFAYPSHLVIEDVKNIFENFELKNLTAHLENNVIHTVMSQSFLRNKKAVVKRSGIDKKLTDHDMITVIVNEKE